MPEPSAATNDPVTDEQIDAAVARISSLIRRTPILETRAGELGVDSPLTLKLECLQHTGSFKARGALNNALSRTIPEAGLTAASGGNHGVAVAFAAATVGCPAEIFVPSISPAIKRAKIASHGASVTIAGDVYSDAQRACDERRAETGALTIHPYDAVETVAGQATCGRELQEQVPELDTVLVGVGGGGFAAGFAAAYRRDIQLITVEPDTSRCFQAALEAGEPVDVSVAGVAADSLGASRIGDLPWQLLSTYAHDAITVPNDAITAAQRVAWDRLQLVLEPGGAAALAGVLSGAYVPSPGERVGVLLCGSNTDPSTVAVIPSDQPST